MEGDQVRQLALGAARHAEILEQRARPARLVRARRRGQLGVAPPLVGRELVQDLVRVRVRLRLRLRLRLRVRVRVRVNRNPNPNPNPNPGLPLGGRSARDLPRAGGDAARAPRAHAG